MDDSPINSLLSSFERAIKFFVALGAIMYGYGFLTVAVHYSRYNVNSFSLLNADYVVAGLLCLVPLAILSLFTAYYYRRLSNKKEGCLKRLGLALTGLFIVLLVLLCLLGWTNFRYEIVLAFLTIILITGGVVYTVFDAIDGEKPNAVPLTVGMTILLLPILVIYTFFFAYNIYPRIPRAMGGGKPTYVRFALRELPSNQSPTPPSSVPTALLEREGNNRFTIHYKLLLVTDKTYVIQQTANEKATYEFPKDAVSGVIFTPQ